MFVTQNLSTELEVNFRFWTGDLKTSSEGWKGKLKVLLSSVPSLKNSLCKEQVARCGRVKNNYVQTSQERVSSFVQKASRNQGNTKTKMILFDLPITGLPVKPSCLNAEIIDLSRNWYNRERSSSVTVHSDLESVHPKCQLWSWMIRKVTLSIWRRFNQSGFLMEPFCG